MAERSFDPAHLDVAALAAAAKRIGGDQRAAHLERWRAMQSPPVGEPLPAVQWSAVGELRRGVAAAQMWLHLQVHATGWLTCQRCLQPFSLPFDVERSFRFVADEREAEALDADSEDDVLAAAQPLDLLALVEDELLLTWPLVPRHDSCNPPAHHAGEDAAEAGAANPFAALAVLRGEPPRQ